MQTFLGKGLFLSVAPTVLPTVSWSLDKAHFDIVLIREYYFNHFFRNNNWIQVWMKLWTHTVSMGPLQKRNVLYKFVIFNGPTTLINAQILQHTNMFGKNIPTNFGPNGYVPAAVLGPF